MKSDPRAILEGLDQLVSEVSPNQLPALSAALSAAAAAAAARVVLVNGPRDDGNTGKNGEESSWLTVKQAAERLGVTPYWFYRRSKKLPFIFSIGPKKLRVSSSGMDRWVRTNRPK